jgi:hypothetical protein
MFPSFTDGTLAIRRLRVRIDPSDFDPLAARIQLERLLGNVQISSAWLSPSAILCVRQMQDPRPGALRLLARELRPAVEWESGLRSALEQKVRAAVRPALTAVPADAEAVVFADRGELIACLALDCCAGTALDRWWWAALFREADLARAAVAALLQTPEYAPAVFERLARVGVAVAFVMRLTASDVARVEEALLARFGLRDLSRALSARQHLEQEGRRQASARLTPGVASGQLADDSSGPRPAAPWLPFIADSELGSLPPEPRRLLALGLSIQRAPMLMRAQEFVRRFAIHCTDQAPVSPLSAMAQQRVLARPPASEEPAPAKDAGTQFPTEDVGVAQASPARVPAIGLRRAETRLASVSRPDLHSPSEPRHLAAEVLTAQPAEPPREAPWVPIAALFSLETGQVEGVPRERSRSGPSLVDELHRTYGVPTVTSLGGLFYLANLALALELYPDFSRPTDRGASMPIWDFIALVGARLHSDLPADPIWALLRRLAGRAPADTASALFTPPPGWQLPAAWAGLVTERAESETDSWLDWLMPYVRARLLRALGLASPAELATVLLMHTARVHVTDTHVDVLLSLDELPLAIRRAGLDRDPGWLPAAGRFLAFHFG